MAIQLPDGIYTGGAVVVDSRPTVNLYAQHMARKQAKEDALDEYYRKLPQTINQAGTRDQDIPVINQKRAELQKSFMQNKDNILKGKDGGVARFNYEKQIRDLENIIEQSKQAGKIGLELGKMKFDPAKNYIFDDDGIITAIDAHEKPIGAPDHKQIDLATLTIPTKPFDQNKYFDMYSTVKRGKSVTQSPQDKGDFTLLETTNQEYDPTGLATIKNLATNQLQTDKPFRKFVYDKLSHSDAALKELNPIYKKYYGKDIESYEDFATAYTLSGLQPQLTDVKEKADTFGRQKFMEGLRQGNRKDLIYIRQSFQSLKEEQKENRINAIINDQLSESQSTGGEISLNPMVSKELSITDDYGDKIAPLKTRMANDRVEFEYPGGKKVNISMQDYKASLRKIFNQPVTEIDATTPRPKNNQPKPAVTSGYSREDLLKAGWTDAQIKQAVKAGKIKLK